MTLRTLAHICPFDRFLPGPCEFVGQWKELRLRIAKGRPRFLKRIAGGGNGGKKIKKELAIALVL
jgi:hypothetical protein